jgi:hypothetical protein
VRGQVSGGTDLVAGETRHLHLLHAGGVDPGDVDEGRGLPQEPEKLEMLLLQVGGRRVLMRDEHRAELARDRVRELLNPQRGTARLLPLELLDERAGVAVVEVQSNEPTGEHRDADQAREVSGVLPEERPARPRTHQRCPLDSAMHSVYRAGLLASLPRPRSFRCWWTSCRTPSTG